MIEKELIRHHQGRFGMWVYAVNDSWDYSALLSGILASEEVLPVHYDDSWYQTPDGYIYGLPYGFFQPNRLLSYWYIKNKDPDFIRRYVTTGLVDDFEVRDKLGLPFEPVFDPRNRTA